MRDLESDEEILIQSWSTCLDSPALHWRKITNFALSLSAPSCYACCVVEFTIFVNLSFSMYRISIARYTLLQHEHCIDWFQSQVLVYEYLGLFLTRLSKLLFVVNQQARLSDFSNPIQNTQVVLSYEHTLLLINNWIISVPFSVL